MVKRFSFIIPFCIIIILSISFWVLANRPVVVPAWPDTIHGYSFSPMRLEHNPLKDRYPDSEQIDADLSFLADKTRSIRTYSTQSTQAAIPVLAQKYALKVNLGAWIDKDKQANALEMKRLITIAQENPQNVDRVMLGNEVLLRKDLSVQQLTAYLDHVRSKLTIPVSTAEPWDTWVKNPELVKHVDYIAVHMLPYWEGIRLDNAVEHIVQQMEYLKETYPLKPIVITEVGWPSQGRTYRGAVPGTANQAIFLRRFVHRAAQEKYNYYVIEAFDQVWKQSIEGAIGAYWGVFDVQRKAKFEFNGPIVKIAQWRILALLSALLALFLFAFLSIDARSLTLNGRIFLAIISSILASLIVWIIYEYANRYMSLATILLGIFLLISLFAVALVLLIEAHEWAESLWVKERRRELITPNRDDNDFPLVSIHIPANNEPSEMLIETLNALSELDYGNFEVIVIDNNTKDPGVWQPVQAHCHLLGEKFKFFHKEEMLGFKSGALNYALTKTSDKAAIIAVIDSDYCVSPHWLNDLIPQFKRPEIAIVQAPQDYRDFYKNLFKVMCFFEYRGFFHMGMVTRNERNAIIQHGTMTLLRRSVLEQVGGWNETIITEDAELGLMIFNRGYEAVYTNKSYGKGLMPDTFLDYKNQRFRWAYGAMQIIRSHFGELTGNTKSKLTIGQRYHFVAGWLPWFTDAVNLVFTFLALLWTLAMLMVPEKIDPPMVIFSILPLGLFFFKVLKQIYLYRSMRIASNFSLIIAAVISGLALSHTIARAIWLGLFTSDHPFLRTPKMERSAALTQAVWTVKGEVLILLLLWLEVAAVVFYLPLGNLDLSLWLVVLLVQSIPYLSSLFVSVISAFPGLKSGINIDLNNKERRVHQIMRT